MVHLIKGFQGYETSKLKNILKSSPCYFRQDLKYCWNQSRTMTLRRSESSEFVQQISHEWSKIEFVLTEVYYIVASGLSNSVKKFDLWFPIREFYNTISEFFNLNISRKLYKMESSNQQKLNTKLHMAYPKDKTKLDLRSSQGSR